MVNRRVRSVEREFDALRLRITAAEGPNFRRNDALVVTMTSRTAGEGVSTVSAGLARSFARNGAERVLLVDADSARNDIAQRAPGNDATMILKTEDLDPNVPIGTVERWGVDVLALAAGRRSGFPKEMPWQDYFSALRTRYDVIVVDTGALTSQGPYYWADTASQALLVVDTSRTSIEALERLREELKTSKLTVTGVVLNKRDYPIPKWFY